MRRIARFAVAAAALAALAGCFNPFAPRISVERAQSVPAPSPNSSQNLIRRFEWCWRNRAIEEYKDIFTDDYVFAFAAKDAFGNQYRDRPWRREDEMISTYNAFNGNGDRLPVRNVQIDLGRVLIPFDDDRPGRNPVWHQYINTTVHLSLTIPHSDGSSEVQQVDGNAKFYVVRGDSAAIPVELVGKGYVPDSTRWWIERWEDLTLTDNGGGTPSPAAVALPGAGRARPAALAPTLYSSWGALKARFR